MYLPRFALTRRRAALAVLPLGVMAAAWPLCSQWREREFRNSVAGDLPAVRRLIC